MRSERDIKRAPKRALADRQTPSDASGPAPEAPTPPVHNVPVSYAPRSEGGPRGAGGAGRDGFRRDEGPRGPRREADERFRADERRGQGGPRGPGGPGGRPPFGDRPPFGERPAFGNRPPQQREDRARQADDRRPAGPPSGRPQDRRDDRGPRFDPRDERGARRAGPGGPGGPGFGRPERPPFGDRPERGGFGDRPPFRGERPTRPEFAERGPRRDERDPRAEPPRAPRMQALRSDEPLPQRLPSAAPPRVADPADGVRLSKVLGDRGLASRREADDWIAAGWVKVDGEMAVLGQRVQPSARIEIDPAAHNQQAQRVTILLNKPIGYVSGQAEDGYEPASVLITPANHWDEDPSRKPFHPGHARGLAPAGRLDIDSTGLLVLTQDGRIAKHLIGEDSDVEKEYLVRVEYQREGAFPESDLKLLNHGLTLDDKQLKPAKVSWANEDQLRFCLREGRKRQIRRMCELVGLKVVGLKRVRIGSVVLGKLPPGQWRYLRDDERF